ncbi:hypothetical protein DICVIV_03539 [Dictyocaulus viviparus]|uniref:Uncharacterized protein n=1 Tax=Dictyocaulus viviparus TaxID=29172 RepID=A0A0D8Y0X6_DICVI|nr:hypothetical protein DICVIV_03539 [Dictyocaulus viviparus]
MLSQLARGDCALPYPPNENSTFADVAWHIRCDLTVIFIRPNQDSSNNRVYYNFIESYSTLAEAVQHFQAVDSVAMATTNSSFLN